MAKNSCQLKIDCASGVMTASLSGELDHHGAVAVRTHIDAEICRLSPKKTVLELRELDFMDSSGLGLVMGRHALMQRKGGELVVRGANERVMRIFKLAGLERMVRIEGKERANEGKRCK